MHWLSSVSSTPPGDQFTRSFQRPLALRNGAQLVLMFTALNLSPQLAPAAVDYLRDVKPILRIHCFRCHGPLRAESGLRLDTRARALRGGESGAALTPGNITDSLLLQRITADKTTRMPPDTEPLTEEQIDLLKTWISAGANAPAEEQTHDPRSHWSYQPIQRPQIPETAVPEPAAESTATHPIDAFLTQHQQQANVTPRPTAPPHVLLRRVALDLTGLPPSRETLQAFLREPSETAYAQAVDRLLASPHYGERWGRHWLDVWRYSDWYGFQSEVRFSQKNIWHWRDWVVRSLNADKGYERMLMEMLAADELVPFDPANLGATGFLVRNRNTDSREQWIRDTVEHTAKAFLGITMACVQCHDHPYDPIWHDEYYRFRNIFEPVQVAIDNGGGGPGGIDLAGVARIFDRDRNAVTKFYLRGNDRTPDKDRKITPGIPQIFGGWTEPEVVNLPPLARIPHLRRPVETQTVARLEAAVREAEQAVDEGQRYLVQTEQRLTRTAADPPAATADTLWLDTFQPQRSPAWQVGPGEWSHRDGSLVQSLATGEDTCWLEYTPHQPVKNFSLQASLRITTGRQAGEAGISFDRSDEGGRNEGVFLTTGQEQGLGFFSAFEENRNDVAKLFRSLDVMLQQTFVLTITVRNRLVNVYINDVLQQSYQLVNRAPGGFRLWTRNAAAEFDYLKIDALPENEPLAPQDAIALFAPIVRLAKSDPVHLALSNSVVKQARLVLANRRAELVSHQATWTADAWRFLEAPPADATPEVSGAHKTRHDELAILAQRAQRAWSVGKAAEARFLAEHAKQRAQALAADGPQGDAKLAKSVADATKKLESASLQLQAAEKAVQEPPTPKYSGLQGIYGSSSGRRLSLARWVADLKNPLTARVAVNHVWLRHFGRPLVQTVFDFGLSGQQPSHPQLLDWLAAELRQPSLTFAETDGQWYWKEGQPPCNPWSTKHLHRLIVTSQAYRRASTIDPANMAIDPDNLLLWRMPAQRMDAEIVRDSVLAVSETLDRTLGGPALPVTDGMSVPRRSLYFHHSPETQMKFLKLFDGADPTECYSRHVSIVPHQALALFNSKLTLVQARKLAASLSRTQPDINAFIQAAFEQVLSRPPTETDRQVCRQFLQTRETVYRAANTANPEETANPNAPSTNPTLHARENLVHSLFNHHDFVTIK